MFNSPVPPSPPAPPLPPPLRDDLAGGVEGAFLGDHDDISGDGGRRHVALRSVS